MPGATTARDGVAHRVELCAARGEVSALEKPDVAHRAPGAPGDVFLRHSRPSTQRSDRSLGAISAYHGPSMRARRTPVQTPRETPDQDDGPDVDAVGSRDYGEPPSGEVGYSI